MSCCARRLPSTKTRDPAEEDPMKAIVQDKYGTADALNLEGIEEPVVGSDNVLLRVHAASAHMGDWHFMTGLPYLFRIAGAGLRAPKTRVRGTDVAGRVEVVGKDVTHFQPGDEVFGTCDGAFAEHATAQPDKIAPKPANLTFEQAATVPTSGSAALQALRDVGKVQPRQKVLIIGAAGGVGSFAVQIAKAFGAHVTGVCSTTKVDLVRSIGADDVIDYTRDDFAEMGQRYDLILDIAGARSVSHLRRALAPRGTLVIVGGEGGGRWFGGIDRQLRASILSPFVSQKLGTFIAKAKGEDLVVLKELIEAGKVTPVIGKTYPLSEVPEAIRYLEEGHAQGKVVITV
jgi:NADPH:quinone reductase-like Zn-dependent oxidoreductase